MRSINKKAITRPYMENGIENAFNRSNLQQSLNTVYLYEFKRYGYIMLKKLFTIYEAVTFRRKLGHCVLNINLRVHKSTLQICKA